MPSLGRFTLVAAVLIVTSCTKKTEEKKAEETPPPVAATAQSTASTVAPVASVVPGAADVMTTLGDRLLKEARNRPPIHPNADEILGAFEKQGGGVAAKKQGLGATYKASFCEGGTTNDGSVTMSICEYADDTAAQAGLVALQTIYPAKQANHVLHKGTVLTTLRLKDGPAPVALENKLLAAYKTL